MFEPCVKPARQGSIQQHHGLGRCHAGFSAADDQNVDAERADRFQVETGRGSIGQAGTVQMHPVAFGLHRPRQGGDRTSRIERSVLCSVGQREARHCLSMGIVGSGQGGHKFGRIDAAGRARQSDQSQPVAKEARCAGFIGDHMGVLMGQDGLEGSAERRQGYGVGRRARSHEPDLGVGI